MRALIPLLLLIAIPVAAQAPAVVSIELSSFAFAPETIRLRADIPVTLRLTNAGRAKKPAVVRKQHGVHPQQFGELACV